MLSRAQHMVKKPTPAKSVPAQADAEARLQEAVARLKAATDRHDAVVSALSRIGVSAQERRFAQGESKKVERELRDARRLLEEAQATAPK
jgi:signal transduction histidine kinase